MGSLGAISTSILRGSPVSTRERVVTWQVSGIDGYGVMTLGKGDAEFDLTAIVYTTNAASAEATKLALIGLQGTIVEVVDDLGASYPNIAVIHVQPPTKTPCIWSGYATAVRVEAKLKCLNSSAT